MVVKKQATDMNVKSGNVDERSGYARTAVDQDQPIEASNNIIKFRREVEEKRLCFHGMRRTS